MGATQRDWGASGLAHLTGQPPGRADFSRAAVLGHAQEIADRLNQHLGVSVDAAELLTGRAALLGLSGRGRLSAGGASRLIPTRAGWCTLTLSRQDDIDTVPALVEGEVPQDDLWSTVERWAAVRTAVDVVERARLLGLPAAVLGEATAAEPKAQRIGTAVGPRDPSGLLVVDLSSMWAGPLCGQLLSRAGSVVVKVESLARPDGTRGGSAAFFDWMNSGKLCYAAEFAPDGRLRALLEAADVVIESSRPAALGRRRLGAGDVSAREGRVWLRITGHGVRGEQANWSAFGDDAAVAGGLVGGSSEHPVFCGDAIADPLTGLQAALAVCESLARGGGEVVDVVMAAVAATYATLPVSSIESDYPAMLPKPPASHRAASPLGADNDRVERLIADRRLASC